MGIKFIECKIVFWCNIKIIIKENVLSEHKNGLNLEEEEKKNPAPLHNSDLCT